MRVLFDVNVLLDILLEREPFVDDSAEAWARVETGKVTGLVSADSFSTMFYLIKRAADLPAARHAVRLVADVFEIVPLDGQVVSAAIDAPIADLEDAIQHESAVRAGADGIVTRDATGFRQAALRVLSPARLLEEIDD